MQYKIMKEVIGIAIRNDWDSETFKEIVGQTIELDLLKEHTEVIDGYECVQVDTTTLDLLDNLGQIWIPIDCIETFTGNEEEKGFIMSFEDKMEEAAKKRKLKNILLRR